MEEHPMAGRRDLRRCQCGKEIVFDFLSYRTSDGRHDVKVVAYDPQTGDELEECPMCGISLSITKGTLQRQADQACKSE